MAIVRSPFGFFFVNLKFAQSASGWSEDDFSGRGIVGQCCCQRGRRGCRSLFSFLAGKLGLGLPFGFQLLLLPGLPGSEFPLLLLLLFKAFGLLPGFFLLESIGLAFRLRLLPGFFLLEPFGLAFGLERFLALEKVEGDIGHSRQATGSAEVIDTPE